MRARLRVIGLLGALVLVTAACDWSMVGYNAGRSGFNLFEKSITPSKVGGLTEKWRANAGSGTSAPVVSDGRVFVTTQPVGTTPGDVQEYDADGVAHCNGASPAVCNVGWRQTMEAAGPVSAPVVASGWVWAGGSYVDSVPGFPNFVFATRYGGAFAPATGEQLGGNHEGVSYVGAYSDGILYGYDMVGVTGLSPRFQVLQGLGIHGIDGSDRDELLVGVRGTPPTVVEGVIYLVRDSGDLAVWGSGPPPSVSCLPFQSSETLLVSCAPNWTVHLQAGVGWDGMVTVARGLGYVPELDGKIEVFETAACGLAVCPVAWTAEAGSKHMGPLSVTDDTLFASSDDGHLYAFDATGCGAATCQPKWSANLGSALHAPSVAGSVLFTGSEDGHLYAFNAAGCGHATCTPLWTGNVGAPVRTAPVISGGRVFVTDTTGTIHAFGL